MTGSLLNDDWRFGLLDNLDLGHLLPLLPALVHAGEQACQTSASSLLILAQFFGRVPMRKTLLQVKASLHSCAPN